MIGGGDYYADVVPAEERCGLPWQYHQPTSFPGGLVQVARAIYRTRWQASTPAWDSASDNVRAWVRVQATAAIEAISMEQSAVRRQRHGEHSTG